MSTFPPRANESAEPSPRIDLPLHVERLGDGVPVLFLHSSGLSGRQWRKLAAAAAGRGLRAVLPDLTGHGASEARAEPRPFSFREDVAHAIAILDAEGPAHVVAHSYGGLVALQAAIAAPGAIRSLSLYDPVAFGVLDRETDAEAIASLPWSALRQWGPLPEDRERWLQSFVDYWGGAGAWAALREEARAEFRRVAWAVREGVTTLMEDTTPASAYAIVRAPAVLITGEQSPIAAQRVARRLAGALPDARTVTIPGAGHMGPLSHAEAVQAAVLDAIARGAADGRAP